MEFLIHIPALTDYDHLQQIETDAFDALHNYKIVMEKEKEKKNKTVNANKNQVETNKSHSKNSNGLLFERSKILQQTRAEENQKAIEELKLETKKLEDENKEIKTFQKHLQEIFDQLQQQIALKKKELFRGLLPERIQEFEQFQANESFVKDQCAICMEDVEIGRNMMRLDCDGQHTFCQVCIEGWFAEHRTCPICKHIFK